MIQLGAVASAFALIWLLSHVLLLLFAGILLATAGSVLAGALSRVTGLPRGLALAVVVLGIPALLLGVVALMGPQMVREVNELRTALPEALDAADAWLREDSGLGIGLREVLGDPADATSTVPWASLAAYVGIGVGGVVNAVLIGFMGVYLAATPGFYLRGFVSLMPHDLRPRVADAMRAAGDGLEGWLLGQVMSMAVIGVLSGVGLWLLGVPMAASLGVLAGVLGFVPFIGATLFTAIAVIFAFSQGAMQALYVLLLCIAVQQLEGEVITPLIQRWAVALPPLLTIMAVLVFGTLFGFMGVLVATPLMVVVMILVQRLYLDQRPEV